MALTVNTRFTSVDGPMKREVVRVTSDGTDDDTVESRIQNPDSVSIRECNTDRTGTAQVASVTLSGKVATIRDAVNNVQYILEFVGF